MRRRRIIIVFLVALSSVVPAEEHVLIVHSYHPEFSWTAQIDRGIHDNLDGANADIRIHTEYLDSKRHPADEVSSPFLGLLRTKYEDEELTAVITSDDNAFRLVSAHRQELFGDSPIFFCGLNNYRPQETPLDHGITGTVEAIDFGANMALISDLHPEVERIVAVSGLSVTAGINLEEFRRASLPFSDRFSFEYLEQMTLTEVLARLETLGTDSVVFNLGLFRDPEGRIMGVKESSALLAGHAPVPVYTAWDFMVSGGVVGGIVVDGYLQGASVARQLLQYVNGTPVEEIALETAPTTRGLFDHQALKRFDIVRRDLPRTAVVRGQPATLYYQRRVFFWLVIIVPLVLLSLIAVLLLSRLRRLKAERSLRKTLHEKETLLREIHHRVKNNLQVVSSLLSLQLRQFEPRSQSYVALANSRSRILTMAQVHELLYDSVECAIVSARDYLVNIARQGVLTAQTYEVAVDLQCQVDDVALPIDTAIPMGLIVNELVLNCVKHAFSRRDRGMVSVVLARNGSNMFLSVIDDGVGFDFQAARRHSMGLQLVEALTLQLHGTLTHSSIVGSQFEILMPTPDP